MIGWQRAEAIRMGMRAAQSFNLALALLAAAPAVAQPFEGGWRLDPTVSTLSFQSVKNGSIVESSEFAAFSGGIDGSGQARISIELNSVDTKIDLRNVRMRFLFFETFKFPTATVSARIDPASVAELPERRRMRVPVDYTLDLHGVAKELDAETIVTLISDDMVSVASAAPIPIAVEMFDLEEGRRKLEDAANVTIVPSGSVTFDFVFRRGAPDFAAPAPKPEATAVERTGDLNAEECAGRFEILSRTGAVYFRSGSDEIDIQSAPFLETVVDIANRCRSLKILIAGHTDSSGSAARNQTLSEARAAAVRDYLTSRGLAPSRLRAVGFGESQPVAPNDTDRNKARNRRIEFSVDNG